MMRRPRCSIVLAAALAALVAFCIFPSPAFAPPVIVAVAVYAVTGALSYGIIAALAVTLLMTFLNQPSKPEAQGPQASSPQNPAITVRQPAAPRQMIFGRYRTGGVFTFIHMTGSDNSTLHMVVTLSGHPVRSVDAVVLADQVLTLDASGNCTASGPLVPVINPDPNAQTPPDFVGKVRCVFGTGTTAGDAAFMAALIGELPDKWTADHRQSGCAKAYLKLTYDRNVFPGGIPNPSFIVSGYSEVVDPRVAGSPGHTGWTDNAALCIAQYFRDQQLALGYAADEIDDDALIAAANSCDEIVARGGPFAFTADAALDRLTFTGGGGFPSGQPLYFQNAGGVLPGGLAPDTPYYWIADPDDPTRGQVSASTVTGGQPGPAVNLTDAGTGTHSATVRTVFTVATSGSPAVSIFTLADLGSSLRCGTRFRVSSTGGGSPDRDNLPIPLLPNTDYFWIPITLTTGQAATSLANARAGTAIELASAGHGTLLLTANGEPRYRLNGVIDTSTDPHTVIARLLTAMAGTKTDSGGKVVLYAGVWQGSGPVFDETMLDTGVTTTHRRSRRDVFNGQKGTFFNPDNGWQSTDYPAVQVAAYVAEDSGLTLWKDGELPFTDSPTACQRIARIAVERIRRQIAVTLGLNLAGLQARAGQNIGVTNTVRGWTAKAFEVTQWGFADRSSQQMAGGGTDEPPRIGIDISGEEIDADVFAWDSSVDEASLRPAATTNLPKAFVVPAPGTPTLESGTNVLDQRLDGTIFSRIHMTWAASASGFVTSGGFYDIEYRKGAGSPLEPWRPYGTVRGDQTEAYILDVADGEVYRVRIAARLGGTGAQSAWVESADHTVIGKTALPSDVSGFVATQNGASVNFSAAHIDDLDLDRIEVRRCTLGDAVWTHGQPTANILRGQAIATETVPPGAWTFLGRAFDRTQNESANVARYDLVVTNPNTVVATVAQAPDWLNLFPAGSPSPSSYGFVVHPNGALVPDDQHLASYYGDELFDQFVPTPVAGPYYYEAPEIDLTLDGTVRLYATISAALGAGETLGFADTSLEIDYRSSSGAYQGFQPFSAGNLTARYVKARLKMDPDSGKGFVSAFTPTADAPLRSEFFNAVAIANPPAAITFAQRFFTTPNVQVTPVGATGQVGQPTAVSTSQCTPGLFNPATGAATTGTANVAATGV